VTSLRQRLRREITTAIQRVFWVYHLKHFIIDGPDDLRAAGPNEFRFVPITHDNYSRVGDFRSQDRIAEYRAKIARGEVGFFAQRNGQMVASIWATINHQAQPVIARGHIKLMSNEALIHDIVTGEAFRGIGAGPFMVENIATALLREHRVRRVIIDVNSDNRPSLRMMEKVGLRAAREGTCISAFGKPIWERWIQPSAVC